MTGTLSILEQQWQTSILRYLVSFAMDRSSSQSGKINGKPGFFRIDDEQFSWLESNHEGAQHQLIQTVV